MVNVVYKLYWVCQEGMTDPSVEGYVGITSQDSRLDYHLASKTHNPIVNNKKNKKIVILEDGLTKQEAEQKELALRPERNIGWNINKGGNIPPSQKGKTWTVIDRKKKSKEDSMKCPQNRGKKCFTNGEKNIYLFESEEIPEGYRKGTRTKSHG